MTHRFKGERTLMRIFIGESDKYQGKALYDALVERLRAKGLAGATVLRGVAGFGASSTVHTDKILKGDAQDRGVGRRRLTRRSHQPARSVGNADHSQCNQRDPWLSPQAPEEENRIDSHEYDGDDWKRR